ncbi:hypothetical protein DOM22_09585 [Bdellovibrio sp. ZAP7]|uniref:hypothetical protein n=1 Tax=Bdellovibrio sp. ZAP7 TaxID=2231053 RepID=UPI0011583582|nr:hypothetical protein [Bdellovibrio sp. ZAP7]QDK45385.1 hypothetical protein DOM22_09585 [Bdellovibrio sp. ZAP7]
MKKYIFLYAFIVLTVGCQPSKDGTLLTHYETDPFAGKSKDRQDTTVLKVDGQVTQGYNTTTSESNIGGVAEEPSSVNDKALATVYDAIVRLRMDIAGTTDPGEDLKLLEKLLQSKQGAEGLDILKAIEAKKLALHFQLTDEEKSSPDVAMNILAQAFKQMAAANGLDEESQSLISKAILTRAKMLAPSESQKSLAQVNGQLLQDKMNALIVAATTNKTAACAAMSTFAGAITNFYEDTQYSLPALIKNKIKYVRAELVGSAQCQLSYASLLSVVDMITFDLGSLELYLTPKNTFNWENLEDYKIKAPLQEAVAMVKEGKEIGTLAATDVVCKLDGGEVNFQEYPLKIEKAGNQRGVTVSFVAEKGKVPDFQKMNLTKIEPDILVLAVNVIPGSAVPFQFTFFNAKRGANSTIKCSLATP